MRDHWEQIYTDRVAEELAWHEPVPATLPLVLAHSEPDEPVIDAGGGASTLAGHLVRHGYSDVTVVDLSWSGLEHARRALGPRATTVHWCHGDVLALEAGRTWALWHDRAVFHFLTEVDDRRRYRTAMVNALVPGGRAIVATFAPSGPERCAGLPVRRYDIDELAAEFAPELDVVDGVELTPTSATGDQRPYVAVVLRLAPPDRRTA